MKSPCGNDPGPALAFVGLLCAGVILALPWPLWAIFAFVVLLVAVAALWHENHQLRNK